MHSRFTREVANLMPAGKSRRDYYCFWSHFSYGGKLTPLSNLAGDLEVLRAVAERSCHSAATRIRIGDYSARDASHQRFRGRQQPHRFLMAVPMQQNMPRSRRKIERQTLGFDELLEGGTRARY